MKNAINFFYNLNIEYLHFYHQRYYFDYYNQKYVFLVYTRSEEEIVPLVELNIEALKQDPNYHQIILNKSQQPITVVENVPYVLLRLGTNEVRYLQLDDVYALPIVINKKTNILNRFSWTYLWSRKIDYIEYQLSHFEVKHSSLIENVWYFIGLGENAITYVENITESKQVLEQEQMTIAHRRLSPRQELFDYYNPLSLVIDHQTRDISEYLKNSFIEDNYDISKIASYLSSLNLSFYGYALLFGRMLFPSFYFDAFEKVMSEGTDDKEILLLNRRIREYELYLNDLFWLIRCYARIDTIDWLIKKT